MIKDEINEECIVKPYMIPADRFGDIGNAGIFKKTLDVIIEDALFPGSEEFIPLLDFITPSCSCDIGGIPMSFESTEVEFSLESNDILVCFPGLIPTYEWKWRTLDSSDIELPNQNDLSFSHEFGEQTEPI